MRASKMAGGLRSVAPVAFAVAALAVSVAVVGGAGPSVASAQGASDAGDAGDASRSSLPACVGVKTESRYIPYGYNHVVILTNGCTKVAACSVATDVNPQPVSVEVPSGATIEVLTFSASPSQVFNARVSCKLR